MRCASCATRVEGLLHVSRLPDHFELDESGRALVARRSRYELGDRVTVRVEEADPVSGRIDFAPVRRPRRRRAVGD